MALNTINTDAISFKKLSGKAHTQQNFAVTEESMSSNVQISFATVFARVINPLPITNGGLSTVGSTDGVVKRVKFDVEIIPDTQIAAGRSQGYRLKLQGSETISGVLYPAGTILNSGLGKLQIVPSLYGTVKGDGSTEYDPILYQTNGSTIITKFDPINWYLDFYGGVLFVQDPPSGYDSSAARPGVVEAFLYVGDYISDVLAPVSGQTGTTASNVGGGAGVFKEAVLNDLRFRSFIGQNGIAVTATTNNVIVSYTGATGSSSNLTFGNGLTKSGNNVVVGGSFTGDTTTTIPSGATITYQGLDPDSAFTVENSRINLESYPYSKINIGAGILPNNWEIQMQAAGANLNMGQNGGNEATFTAAGGSAGLALTGGSGWNLYSGSGRVRNINGNIDIQAGNGVNINSTGGPEVKLGFHIGQSDESFVRMTSGEIIDLKNTKGGVNIDNNGVVTLSGQTYSVFLDTIGGFKYADNYSADYEDRTLPDVEWVNNAIQEAISGITGTTGGSANITASNGLTKVGDDIQLGGSLSGDTTINTGPFGFKIQSSEDYNNIIEFASWGGFLMNTSSQIITTADLTSPNQGIYFGVKDTTAGSEYVSQLSINSPSAAPLTTAGKGVSIMAITPNTLDTGIETALTVGRSSGTFPYPMAPDFGVAIDFLVNMNDTSLNAQLKYALTGVTLGAEDGYYRFSVHKQGTIQDILDLTGDGLKYREDYSANYEPRSLVDYGFITGVTAATEVHAGNGLSMDGNTVVLGGTGSSANVLMYGTNLTLANLNESGTGLLLGSSDSNDYGSFLYLYEIGSEQPGYKTAFRLTPSTARFIDQRDTPSGLEYQGDYSAGFGPRSIPDVAWVTAHTTSGGTGSPTINMLSVTTDETIANTVDVVLVDSSGGPLTVTLPSSPNPNRKITIKDRTGNALANNITVDGNGKNIDGSTTALLNSNRSSIEVVYSEEFDEFYIVAFVS